MCNNLQSVVASKIEKTTQDPSVSLWGTLHLHLFCFQKKLLNRLTVIKCSHFIWQPIRICALRINYTNSSSIVLSRNPPSMLLKAQSLLDIRMHHLSPDPMPMEGFSVICNLFHRHKRIITDKRWGSAGKEGRSRKITPFDYKGMVGSLEV